MMCIINQLCATTKLNSSQKNTTAWVEEIFHYCIFYFLLSIGNENICYQLHRRRVFTNMWGIAFHWIREIASERGKEIFGIIFNVFYFLNLIFFRLVFLVFKF